MPDTASATLRNARDSAFPKSWYPMALAREIPRGALIRAR